VCEWGEGMWMIAESIRKSILKVIRWRDI
jgi:hypothetical protein